MTTRGAVTRIAVSCTLAAFGLICDPTQASAQGQGNGTQNNPNRPLEVKVVSPVPLPVTGSVEVSGGSVEVSGTVNVRDVDKTVSEHFQESIQDQVEVGSGITKTSFTFSPVPAGKRLIIEHVSAYVRLLSTGGSLTLSFFDLQSDMLTPIRINGTEVMTNLPTKVVVESGQLPTIRLGGNFGLSAGPNQTGLTFDFRGFISGTLVPEP